MSLNWLIYMPTHTPCIALFLDLQIILKLADIYCILFDVLNFYQALSWSSDWLVPQRLLKKRVIKLLKGAEPLTEESPEITNLPCEWLVKWKGLGYEGITWELDNTPLFTSLEAILLKSDYEQRMRRAKEYSNHKRFEKV